MPILIGHRQDLRSIGGMKPTRPAVCCQELLAFGFGQFSEIAGGRFSHLVLRSEQANSFIDALGAASRRCRAAHPGG
jgi:hypothetical protein